MRPESFASKVRIAIVVLTVGAGRAFAGFTDMADASQISPPPSLNQNAIASTDENEIPPALTFDQNPDVSDAPARDSQLASTHGQTDVRSTQPGVAAPLPGALIPGGMLLIGSFVVTRVFRRRLA